MMMKLGLFVALLGVLDITSAQTLRSSGSYILGNYDVPLKGSAVTRKTYYLTFVFKTTWIEAFNFCKSSTMDLVTFDSQAELDAYLKLVEAAAAKFTLCPGHFVGGVTTANPPTTSSWAWLHSGETVSQTLTFGAAPTAGKCLSISLSGGKATFANVDCLNYICTFVCTDVKVMTPTATVTSTKPNIVDNINNKGYATVDPKVG